MAKLRAVLLAAGRGVRMGGERPKALIPMGDHAPLLHHALAGLRSAGIEDLLVVTGFMPQAVEAAVAENWTGEATFVRNVRYASWGNFHSVRVALDSSPGFDVLVVNSDIVVAPDVFTRVANGPGDLVLAVQKRMRLNDEDMRVHLEGTRVRGVSKAMSRARSHGEYAGVSLLRTAAHGPYQEVATRFEWTGETSLYYEDVYHRMADVVDVRAVIVGLDEYAEVDTPEDVAFATAVIARLDSAVAN